MVSVMGTCGGLVGPKTENVEKVLVFKTFIKGEDGHDYAKTANNSPGRRVSGSLWIHFGIILGSFRGHFGIIFGIILRSFWDHFGLMLGSYWAHLGIILG